jgi:hypothetical protein
MSIYETKGISYESTFLGRLIVLIAYCRVHTFFTYTSKVALANARAASLLVNYLLHLLQYYF